MTDTVKVFVKSTWHGQVGIRDKYVKDALVKGQGLLIVCQNDSMKLTPDEVKSKVKGMSEQPFKDRYSNEEHYLVYYLWQPNGPKQGELYGK